MVEEVWEPVPEWEGLYEVSNLGRAKNTKTSRIKNLDFNNYGYARIQCYDGKRRAKHFIHRLVAQLFVKGFKEGYVVNHIDCDKTNNVYTNLEWVTRSRNNAHAIENGLSNIVGGKRECKLTSTTGFYKTFESVCACGRYLGLSDKRLHHLIKTQGGFIPEFNLTIEKVVK